MRQRNITATLLLHTNYISQHTPWSRVDVVPSNFTAFSQSWLMMSYGVIIWLLVLWPPPTPKVNIDTDILFFSPWPTPFLQTSGEVAQTQTSIALLQDRVVQTSITNFKNFDTRDGGSGGSADPPAKSWKDKKIARVKQRVVNIEHPVLYGGKGEERSSKVTLRVLCVGVGSVHSGGHNLHNKLKILK